MAWKTGFTINARRFSNLNASVAGSTSAILIAGWFYPTTLTAGRGLWAVDTITGSRIATTTSELNMDTNNVTDGQWLTSGLGLAVDTWRFIAWMLNTGTAPAAAWRVWAGTVDTAPTEITVTNPTAASGNFTAATAFTLGNRGNSSVAFQGDIGDAVFIHQGVATAGPLGVAAGGTITQDEADQVYRTLVVPIWKGNAFPPATRTFAGLNAFEATFIPGDLNVAAADTTHARPMYTNVLTSSPSGTMTLSNSPTKSAQRSPVSMRGQNLHAHEYMRR